MLWAVVFWQGMRGYDRAELAIAWGDTAKTVLRSSLQKSGYVVRESLVADQNGAEEFQAAVRARVIR